MFRALVQLAAFAALASAVVIKKKENPFSTLDEQAAAAAKEGGVKPQHTLRVCNAFPFEKPLAVYHGREEISEDGGALKYKDCRDFVGLKLKSADQIRFKVSNEMRPDGEQNAGIFQIGQLPQYSSILMLVVHRHDTLLDSVAFKTHVFRNLPYAQAAVLDTYTGVKKAQVEIADHVDSEAGEKPDVSEPLKFGGVRKLNTGFYDLKLFDTPTMPLDLPTLAEKKDFVVLPSESYVVLRIGAEDRMGANEDTDELAGGLGKEELLVFPSSDHNKLVQIHPNFARVVSLKYMLIVGVVMVGFVALARWVHKV